MIEYVIPLPLVNPCYSKRATYRAVLALSTKIPIMTSIAHYQVVFLAKSAHRCSLIGDSAQPRLLWSVAIHIQTFQNSGGVRSRLRSYKLLLFQNASSCRPSAPPMTWADRSRTSVNTPPSPIGIETAEQKAAPF